MAFVPSQTGKSAAVHSGWVSAGFAWQTPFAQAWFDRHASVAHEPFTHVRTALGPTQTGMSEAEHSGT